MRLLGLILLTCVAAFAQVTDGIATSVTRTVILTADQADFSLIAAVPLATTQQQVMQILQEAGFPNLTSTGTYLTQTYDYSRNPPNTDTVMVYQFSLTVPAGELATTVKAAEALRTKLPATLTSFQYAAGLSASPTTIDAMRQTLLPQLFAEAQKRAQGLATAAGLKLGAIKGVSESSYSAGGNYAGYIGGGVGLSSISGSTVGSAGTQYTFYANISFGLAQ
jgi:uncharacterized protein YggE